MYEYEIEAVLEAGFRRNGADRVGYPSIVGSGPNSTTLHYDVNRRQTRDGDLVVVDAGARSEEHTSELQSPCNLVCRLLLEKKKKRQHFIQRLADDETIDDVER